MAKSAEDIVVKELSAGRVEFDGLLPALQRLDRLLERAVAAAQTAYGTDAATDFYRGLYINQTEVERLLAREPGAPALRAESSDDSLPDAASETSRLAWLQRAFGLSSFDLDVLLIALAPELDLRYERLYAYLQDDVTRRRPSVDLTLNLLCQSAGSKVNRRAHFAPNAPLIYHGLLRLFPDPHHTQPPLLGYYLKADEQIVSWLLGEHHLDERLSAFSELIAPFVTLSEAPLDDQTERRSRR